MPTYRIEYLERIDLLTAEGKKTADAKEKLDNHLASIGVEPKRYFYLEMYVNGEVGGAMVHAEVDPDTESSSGIKRNKLPASDYVIIESTEEDYMKSALGDKTIFRTNDFLKENNFKSIDFPVFERYLDGDTKMVRFFFAVKRK